MKMANKSQEMNKRYRRGRGGHKATDQSAGRRHGVHEDTRGRSRLAFQGSHSDCGQQTFPLQVLLPTPSQTCTVIGEKNLTSKPLATLIRNREVQINILTKPR